MFYHISKQFKLYGNWLNGRSGGRSYSYQIKISRRGGQSNLSEYRVDFLWDYEADVWVATSDDIPGLVLESGSFDALVERVRFALPELLELNGIQHNGAIPIYYSAEKRESLRIAM
jgi:hypothetical protein